MTINLQEAVEHHKAGRLLKARDAYTEILRQSPKNSDAWHLLGLLAHQAKDYTNSVECIKKAIELNGSFAPYHYNLGLSHYALQHAAEARDCFKKALQLNPAYGDAQNMLGHALRDLSDLNGAQAAWERAIDLKKKWARGHLNLGHLHTETGAVKSARACYAKAAELQKDWAEPHLQLGRLLRDAGKLEEARDSLRQAVACDANNHEASNELGQVLSDLGDVEGAKTAFAHDSLKALLDIPKIMQSEADLRRTREAAEANLKQLLEKCPPIADPVAEVGTTSFYFAYHARDDRELQASIARYYRKACPSLSYVAPEVSEPHTDGIVRVGFISSFFHHHTIGDVNVGIIEKLARSHFRTVLLRLPGPEDALSTYIRQHADEVVEVPPKLEEARRVIAEQRLDVLFYTDIGMDPITYYLAYSRLAPLQVVTWGHPVTTGIDTLDYYISAEDYEPEGAEKHYTEKLVKLRFLPTFYYPPAVFQPMKTRKEFGLSEDEHLYLCSQAPFKLHPDFDPILRGILQGDPQGRVLMVRSQNPEWTRELCRRFRRTIPDVFERIQFLPHQRGQHYLHLLRAVDVLLDSTHFGGGNTTLKSLAAGTPIVTMPGEFARGRVTYCCYRRMNMMECVALNPQEYVQLALRLANDMDFRKKVKDKIVTARAALFENDKMMEDLEVFLYKTARPAAAD